MSRNQNNNNLVFTSRFRLLLEKNCGDQTTFARKSGLSRQSVGFWYNGDRLPDMSSLKRICEFFHVSADYLLGISDAASLDTSVKEICNQTHLSEETVNVMVNGFFPPQSQIKDDLLEFCQFSGSDISHCSVLFANLMDRYADFLHCCGAKALLSTELIRTTLASGDYKNETEGKNDFFNEAHKYGLEAIPWKMALNYELSEYSRLYQTYLIDFYQDTINSTGGDSETAVTES